MSEGRYNIPKQYKVDKGMPLEALFQNQADQGRCGRADADCDADPKDTAHESCRNP